MKRLILSTFLLVLSFQTGFARTYINLMWESNDRNKVHTPKLLKNTDKPFCFDYYQKRFERKRKRTAVAGTAVGVTAGAALFTVGTIALGGPSVLLSAGGWTAGINAAWSGGGGALASLLPRVMTGYYGLRNGYDSIVGSIIPKQKLHDYYKEVYIAENFHMQNYLRELDNLQPLTLEEYIENLKIDHKRVETGVDMYLAKLNKQRAEKGFSPVSYKELRLALFKIFDTEKIGCPLKSKRTGRRGYLNKRKIKKLLKTRFL